MISQRNPGASHSPREIGYAALFIDFENLYYHLSGQYVDHPDVNDAILDLLRNLRAHLEERFALLPIIQKAYADFERLKTPPQGSLYLMGIDTHNVLGTEHKNAADMRLCIDAMEVLYTRPEIESFIFVAGDRDYIPVVQHLRRQARSVLVAAFKGNTSGDLLLNVGEANFIEAAELIDPRVIRRLEEAQKRSHAIEESLKIRAAQAAREAQEAMRHTAETPALEPATVTPVAVVIEPPATDVPSAVPEREPPATPSPASSPITPPVAPSSTPSTGMKRSVGESATDFPPTLPITDESQRACLRLMLEEFGLYHDIFLSPFLRKLSDALPRLADYERKALLIDLEIAGVLRIEKRRGQPFDYSVIVVNYNHPTVRELNPG
jgi:uncharacterized LabA/DUF88 family protein